MLTCKDHPTAEALHNGGSQPGVGAKMRVEVGKGGERDKTMLVGLLLLHTLSKRLVRMKRMVFEGERWPRMKVRCCQYYLREELFKHFFLGSCCKEVGVGELRSVWEFGELRACLLDLVEKGHKSGSKSEKGRILFVSNNQICDDLMKLENMDGQKEELRRSKLQSGDKILEGTDFIGQIVGLRLWALAQWLC